MPWSTALRTRCVSGSLMASMMVLSSSVSLPSISSRTCLPQATATSRTTSWELAPNLPDRLHARLHHVFLQLGCVPAPLLNTRRRTCGASTFNVSTAHALTAAAVPLMLEHSGGGSIINITSTMGRVAGRGFAAYGTAKAALAHYTRLAALDLAPRIRVNAIAPGSILTSALEDRGQQ